MAFGLFRPLIHPHWPDVMVTPRPTGTLACSRCTPNWCEHIQRVVTDGLDATSVWDHVISNPTLPNVTVPILPSKNLWLTVQLLRPENPVGSITSAKVKISHPKPIPRRPESEEVLGFIAEGEGRNVLRQMLLDWFEPLVPPDGHVLSDGCKNLHHSPSTQYKLVNEVRGSQVNKFANAWTNYHFQKCIICHESTRIPRQGGRASASSAQQFPPDLIPQI